MDFVTGKNPVKPQRMIRVASVQPGGHVLWDRNPRSPPMTQPVRFTALPTGIARAYRTGAPDANRMPAERSVSDGGGNPCRHCLDEIPKGAGMLILAYRPFPSPQPYAETGPIFLCADDCRRWEGDGLPPVLNNRASHLIKGYGGDDRIAYGTGRIAPIAALAEDAAALFDDARVRYGHVRSATNNCYTCRIEAA
jgi:hypothetical protein